MYVHALAKTLFSKRFPIDQWNGMELIASSSEGPPRASDSISLQSRLNDVPIPVGGSMLLSAPCRLLKGHYVRPFDC